MLVHLDVSNFALIEHMEIELGPGLNVITGETGAGKSLFVDAVQVALGGRASADFIRSGADLAGVRAMFQLTADKVPDEMRSLGLIAETDDGFMIERQLRREGSNRAWINGRLSSVRTIQDFAEHVVELHGQHEQLGLLQPLQQLRLLDSLGGTDHLEQVAAMGAAVAQLMRLRDQLESLHGDEQARARHLDFLRFQLDEIDRIGPREDEEETLLNRQRMLANMESLQRGTQDVLFELIEGGPEAPSFIERLGRLLAVLEPLVAIDETLEPMVERMTAFQLDIQELSRELRHYGEGLSSDPRELHSVEERLDQLSELKRKYGRTVADVLRFREQVVEEIDRIESSEAEVIRLRGLESEMLDEISQSAEQISTTRDELRSRLEQDLEEELDDLNMEHTKVAVILSQVDAENGVLVGNRRLAFSSTGVDQVEIHISPNPGEALMPLRRIASGGELARIMLALRSLSAETDVVPILIFDEIDAGVGGRAGQSVANKLASLARTHQVLCVTHLPQIAAMADKHFHLTKAVMDGRTSSQLEELTGEDRVHELARMLSGEVQEVALAHARQLLVNRSQ